MAQLTNHEAIEFRDQLVAHIHANTDNGDPPKIRELCDHFQVKKGMLLHHLQKAVDAGDLIRKAPGVYLAAPVSAPAEGGGK